MKVIEQMLEKYETNSIEDKKNAIKEVIQEIVLSGFARTDFFKVASFYGGTALRIFHGLDRFSEDLDFTLMESDPDFNLDKYLPALHNEVNALGLNLSIETKEKVIDSNIKSAFIKGNTKEHFLHFFPKDDAYNKIVHNEAIKIKFEIDINPPAFATTEYKFGLLPYPYQVRMYDMPSLFAGKIHAVICRTWKHRVKGRDLYDYVFYLSKGTAVNLEHLKSRLVQSGFIDSEFELTKESLIRILFERFGRIDYKEAISDVTPFIKDLKALNLWSKEFFQSITINLKTL